MLPATVYCYDIQRQDVSLPSIQQTAFTSAQVYRGAETLRERETD